MMNLFTKKGHNNKGTARIFGLVFVITAFLCLSVWLAFPVSGITADDKKADMTEEPKSGETEETKVPDVSRVLKAWEEREAKYVFVTRDRTDPFLPFVVEQRAATISPEQAVKILTPLQRIELSSLELIAVINYGSNARALVEDSTGIGYIIETGTELGPNNGKVVGIYQATMEARGGLKEVVKPSRIEVKEDYRTYLGKLKSRIVVIPLKGEEK